MLMMLMVKNKPKFNEIQWKTNWIQLYFNSVLFFPFVGNTKPYETIANERSMHQRKMIGKREDLETKRTK